MTPTQARILANQTAAAERRQRRHLETGIRQWYAGDTALIYEAVTRTKMTQSKAGKSVSPILFQAILDTYRKKLNELEQLIQTEVDKQLATK